MEIKLVNSRWLVNGKRIEELTSDEKNALDNKIAYFKYRMKLMDLKIKNIGKDLAKHNHVFKK